jgi:hypothetical protein
MLIYKFKVNFEDQDDFLREIELRADQTFEDFHQAILGNLGLDPGMLASFYLCDHRFRKQKEIQLVETSVAERKQHIEEGDHIDNQQKPLLMRDSELKDFIDDPHQRLLFLYDYINRWTFYIELVKILPEDKSILYPRFSKLTGPVPRELTATPAQLPGVEMHDDTGFFDDTEDMSEEDINDMDRIDNEDPFFGDNMTEPPEDFPDEK